MGAVPYSVRGRGITYSNLACVAFTLTLLPQQWDGQCTYEGISRTVIDSAGFLFKVMPSTRHRMSVRSRLSYIRCRNKNFLKLFFLIAYSWFRTAMEQKRLWDIIIESVFEHNLTKFRRLHFRLQYLSCNCNYLVWIRLITIFLSNTTNSSTNSSIIRFSPGSC